MRRVRTLANLADCNAGRLLATRTFHHILQSHRAKEVLSPATLEEMYWSSSLEDVLRCFESPDCYVLIRKLALSPDESESSTSDVVFDRLDLFSAVMKATDCAGPLSSIAQYAPKLTWVNINDTLDVVAEKMIGEKRQDIAVMEDGTFRGLVTLRSLLVFIRHQMQKEMTHPPDISSQPYLTSVAAMDAFRKASSVTMFETPVPARLASLHRSKSASTRKTDVFEHDNDGGIGLRPSTSLRRPSIFSSPMPIPLVQASPFQESSDEAIEVKTKQESRSQRYFQGRFTKSQLVAQVFCISWCCELLVACCVFCDLCIAAYVFSKVEEDKDSKSMIATGCIIAVYFYERIIRSYGFFQGLLYHAFWLVNFLIVDVSVIVYILMISGTFGLGSNSFAMQVLRLMRILLMIRNINFTLRIRRVISAQKTRFREDGFDLDLTYITKNVIAMSLPALGAEANYRNPMEEVQLFFATKHPDRFLIFNLCKERDYDRELFDGRVERFEIEDHNPPRMNQLIDFIERAAEFVRSDPDNCIAVHCKGGKGRTGVMISAWLLYSQFEQTADDAMKWFSNARTGNKANTVQGVTQPSQIRYVRYAETAFAVGGFYSPRIHLSKIRVLTCPSMGPDGGWDAWFTIEENGAVVYDHREARHTYSKMHKTQEELTLNVGLDLQGDVRIIFYDHDDGRDRRAMDALTVTAQAAALCNALCCRGRRGHGREEDKMVGDEMCFFFWIHTGFVRGSRVVLEKKDVDIACHDKRCRVFSEKFAVELLFGNLPNFTTQTPQSGPFRPILPPSKELIAQSQEMRRGTADPKGVMPSAGSTTAQLSPLQTLGPSMARLSRMPSQENLFKSQANDSNSNRRGSDAASKSKKVKTSLLRRLSTGGIATWASLQTYPQPTASSVASGKSEFSSTEGGAAGEGVSKPTYSRRTGRERGPFKSGDRTRSANALVGGACSPDSSNCQEPPKRIGTKDVSALLRLDEELNQEARAKRKSYSEPSDSLERLHTDRVCEPASPNLVVDESQEKPASPCIHPLWSTSAETANSQNNIEDGLDGFGSLQIELEAAPPDDVAVDTRTPALLNIADSASCKSSLKIQSAAETSSDLVGPDAQNESNLLESSALNQCSTSIFPEQPHLHLTEIVSVRVNQPTCTPVTDLKQLDQTSTEAQCVQPVVTCTASEFDGVRDIEVLSEGPSTYTIADARRIHMELGSLRKAVATSETTEEISGAFRQFAFGNELESSVEDIPLHCLADQLSLSISNGQEIEGAEWV